MGKNRIALVILGIMILFGCTTLKKIDGTSEEEMQKFRMSKDQLWEEVKKVRSDNRRLQGQVDQLKTEVDRSRQLERQAAAQGAELEKIRAEKSALEKRLSQLEEDRRALDKSLEDHQKIKSVSAPSLKVLSGDGDFNSAVKMADRLKGEGYTVGRLGMTPKPAFSRHTVFFASDFEQEARRLATLLGGRTIAKPLTWESAFNLIVVTGKNP